MAAFDRTLACAAAPQQVWEAAHGSLITMNILRSTPGRVVIAADDRLGYVCLITARDGGSHLRLVIDRAETIQAAVNEAATPQALLAALEAAPVQTGAVSTGTRLLNEIKRAAEETAQATTPSTPAMTGAPSPVPAPAAPGGDPYAAASAVEAAPPWDPDRLLRGWSALSGWRLARNWRRLGRPGWMWPTLLPTLLGLALAVALAVVLVVALVVTPGHVLTDSGAILIAVLLVVVALGGLVVMLSVAELQRPAYKLWQQTHDRQALLAYSYPVGKVLVKYTAIFAGIGAVMAALLYFETRPRVFEGGGLSLTYPGQWRIYPHDGLDACADGSCVVVLTRETPASVSSTIWIYHYPTDFRDSKALRDAAWDYTLDAYYPDAALIEGVSRAVGGYPAAGHAYHATDSESYCDQEAYLEDVYVVVDGYAYELQLWTPCEDTFARERAEFHAVLDSITFSAGREQVRAAGQAIVWAAP